MRRTAPGPNRRGSILLEVVLAFGLFVATAMTLLGVIGGAIDSLSRSRDRVVGADHARNALAMIEAGIARPETLSGPVLPWAGPEDGQLGAAVGGDEPFAMDDMFSAADGGDAFADQGQSPLGDAENETGWALEIETEPAEIRGLTLVTVRAFRTDGAGVEVEGGGSVTLRQILPLDADDGEELFSDLGGRP